MAYNGSGTFALYTPGNPVVGGTTIDSTWANNTLSDIATGLSTAIAKDGQTTTTASIPFVLGIAVTTGITTPSTTFALVNTTATTVNFAGGATTAINVGGAGNATTWTATTFTLTGNFVASGTGPHAFGGTTSALAFLRIAGAQTASGGAAFGVDLDTDLTASANGNQLAEVRCAGVTFAKSTFTGLTGSIISLAGSNISYTGTGTLDTVACLRIVDAPTGGTNNYAIFVDAGSVRLDSSLWVEATPTEGAAGEQLTSGGAGAVMTWDAAACLIESKRDIEKWINPGYALAKILEMPIYSFRYRDKNDGGVRRTTTGDTETEYVGPMAHEAPWAMHHGGRILNPINAFGYTALGIQALAARVAALEAR